MKNNLNLKNREKNNIRKFAQILIIIIIVIAAIMTIQYLITANTKNKINFPSHNAIKYIEKKYGFTPNIESTTQEIHDGGIPTKTGYSHIIANYNNKTFNIYISNKKNNTNGVDDYQKTEIEESILKYITAELGKPYIYEIYYNSSFEDNPYTSYTKCINQYYNGNNIKEIINNNEFNIALNYIQDINLKSLENFNNESFFSSKMNIIIGKYKSMQECEQHKLNAYLFHETQIVERKKYLNKAFLNNLYEGEYAINNKYYEFD